MPCADALRSFPEYDDPSGPKTRHNWRMRRVLYQQNTALNRPAVRRNLPRRGKFRRQTFELVLRKEVPPPGGNCCPCDGFYEKDVSVMRLIQFGLLCLFVIAGLTGCSTSRSAVRTADSGDVGKPVAATAQNLERWAPPPVPPAL